MSIKTVINIPKVSFKAETAELFREIEYRWPQAESRRIRQANVDREGNPIQPPSQNWTKLKLTNRTPEKAISGKPGVYTGSTSDPRNTWKIAGKSQTQLTFQPVPKAMFVMRMFAVAGIRLGRSTWVKTHGISELGKLTVKRTVMNWVKSNIKRMIVAETGGKK